VVMGPGVRRDDDVGAHFRPLATRCVQVMLAVSPPVIRGRRECRAFGAPAAARGVVNTRVSHHGHTGNTRHSPRNGFNGFLRALPGDRALLSPSPGAVYCAELERQRRGVRTTRLRRPLQALSSEAPSASTASRPYVRDDGQRPSSGRDVRILLLIWGRDQHCRLRQIGTTGKSPSALCRPSCAAS
jgi:hypothetical protein